MRRREFITLTLIGGAAALPLVVRAQQPAMPIIGFLGLGTLDEARRAFAFISRGLVEAGMSRVATCRFSSALPTMMPTGCRLWRASWRKPGSRRSSQARGRHCGRPARRPHQFRSFSLQVLTRWRAALSSA
jgi:hypothetical protein